MLYASASVGIARFSSLALSARLHPAPQSGASSLAGGTAPRRLHSHRSLPARRPLGHRVGRGHRRRRRQLHRSAGRHPRRRLRRRLRGLWRCDALADLCRHRRRRSPRRRCDGAGARRGDGRRHTLQRRGVGRTHLRARRHRCARAPITAIVASVDAASRSPPPAWTASPLRVGSVTFGDGVDAYTYNGYDNGVAAQTLRPSPTSSALRRPSRRLWRWTRRRARSPIHANYPTPISPTISTPCAATARWQRLRMGAASTYANLRPSSDDIDLGVTSGAQFGSPSAGGTLSVDVRGARAARGRRSKRRLLPLRRGRRRARTRPTLAPRRRARGSTTPATTSQAPSISPTGPPTSTTLW